MSFQVEGQGRAVVLLHSSMSSRNQWRALVDQLRPGYRVISIDLLGYGESRLRRRDTNYRLADEARHVESILAKTLLPCEPFHLVGHSYGGVVALSLAQRSPGRIASLSLFEPVAVHLLPPRDVARVEFERLAQEVERASAEEGPAAGAARFIDYWSDGGEVSQLPELKQRTFAAQLPKAQMEFRAVMTERRAAGWLRDFDVPVCLMSGSASPLQARRVIAFLAAMLPRARRIEFGAGHMAPVTHPDMVNPEIARFIASSEASAGERAPPAQTSAGLLPKALAITLAAVLCAGSATRSMATPPPANAWRELPAEISRSGHYSVVSGDPGAAGGFIVRVELPPGFEMPPHRATRGLQLVVLSGDMRVGHGPIAHPAGVTTLKPGYYAAFGANETYFVSTEHGATMQIFGTGPWKG